MINDIKTYCEQIRKLKVADAQPEILTFYSQIKWDGTIVVQSPSVRVTPGYMFALEQIRAGCPVPPHLMLADVPGARFPTLTEFLPFIAFNVLNAGQNRAIFKLPLGMNLFVNALGSTEGQQLKVPVTFFEGADINVEWFVQVNNLLRSWANTQRIFDPGHYESETEPNERMEFFVNLIGTLVRAETMV